MVGWWLTIAVAFAGKWSDAPSDVDVRRTVEATPAQIHAVVADLRTYRRLFPEECARDWVIREPTTGIDASADVRYTFGPLKRKLTAVITKDSPGSLWQLEHKGPRGWFTQVRYAPGPTDSSTQVTLLSPLNPPPWPFRGVFHQKVRPAMEACYNTALERLEVEVHKALPPE